MPVHAECSIPGGPGCERGLELAEWTERATREWQQKTAGAGVSGVSAWPACGPRSPNRYRNSK